MPAATIATTIAGQDQPQRMPGEPDQATKIAIAARKPATVSRGPRAASVLDRAHRRSARANVAARGERAYERVGPP